MYVPVCVRVCEYASVRARARVCVCGGGGCVSLCHLVWIAQSAQGKQGLKLLGARCLGFASARDVAQAGLSLSKPVSPGS